MHDDEPITRQEVDAVVKAQEVTASNQALLLAALQQAKEAREAVRLEGQARGKTILDRLESMQTALTAKITEAKAEDRWLVWKIVGAIAGSVGVATGVWKFLTEVFPHKP